MAVRKLYKITRELKKDETYAPQGMVIVEAIKANGDPIERGALLDILEKSKALKTTQPTSRVFSFFRQQLLKNGLLKEIKEESAPAEKPVKAAKTEKVKVAAAKSTAAKTTRGKKVA